MAVANTYNTKIIDNLSRADLNFYASRNPGQIVYRLNADQAVLDSRLNESLRQALESLSFILAGLILLNYIYLGIFMVFTVAICYVFYKVLERFIFVTTPILQFRERSRILVIDYYAKILESITSFRGAGNGRFFEPA